MRISTAEWAAQGLRAILDRQASVADAQHQVSSGLRVERAGDDPVAFAAIQRLEQDLSTTDQYQQNIASARQTLGAEEAVLQQVTELLQSVRQLNIQAGDGALDAGSRRALATEVRTRVDELAARLNQQNAQGEYLFAGYQSHRQPFAKDATGHYQFEGDQGVRELEVAPGVRTAVSHSGAALFGAVLEPRDPTVAADAANTGTLIASAVAVAEQAALDASALSSTSWRIEFGAGPSYQVIDQGTGLPIAVDQPEGHGVGPIPYASGQRVEFSGINIELSGAPNPGDRLLVTPGSQTQQSLPNIVAGLADALEQVADGAIDELEFQERLADALIGVDQGLAHVDRARGQIGGRLNGLDSIEASNADWQIATQETLTALKEVDFAEAVSRLNLESVALQAAQQSYVRTMNLSLFNFLR